MNEKDKRELLDWLNDEEEEDETEEEDPLADDDDEPDVEVRTPAPAVSRDRLFSDADEVSGSEPEIAQEPKVEAEPEEEARIEEEAPEEPEAEEEEEETPAEEEEEEEPEEEEEDEEEDVVVARATENDDDEEVNELSPRPRRPSSSRWGPDLSGMGAMLAAGAGSAAAVARSGATHTASLGGAMKNMVFTKKSKSTPPGPSDDEPPSGMFSIGDDEEDEFDERSGESDKSAPPKPPKPTMDPAALALAQHKIAGLRKGQQVVFDSASLPDTVLYSCIKLKSSKMGGISIGLTEKKLIRCIAVNRERILVFDTFDQPVKMGGAALVKSNHHLTELVKLTFPRSREKDVVAMHIRAGLPRDDGSVATKANTYKVPRAQSFIKQLQDRLARFR